MHGRMLAIHRDASYCLTLANHHKWDCKQEFEELTAKVAMLLAEPPRDTLYSYTIRNPPTMLRTFTATPDEKVFISSVSESVHSLYLAVISALSSLCHVISIESALRSVKEALSRVSSAIVVALNKVGAEIFVFAMQPWFERYKIGSEIWHGPSASQMPLVALESLIYGQDMPSRLREHVQFQQKYLPKPLRSICSAMHECQILDFWRGDKTGLREVAKGLLRVRLSHLVLAERAFALQPEASEFARSLLNELIQETRVFFRNTGK